MDNATRLVDQATANPLTITPPSSLSADALGVRRNRTMALVMPREKGDLVTNFQPGSEDDEIDLSRAMSPVDEGLLPHVGKIISVVGVVMIMTEFESDKIPGEMIERNYASLVLADDTIIGTTGVVVMKELAALLMMRSPGRFDPPVCFEVRQIPSAPPKQPYFSLRRVKAQAKATKKGK